MLERKWQPALVLETHTHPSALKALVVHGEMWWIVGLRDLPHMERYGIEGATYWVVRRRR